MKINKRTERVVSSRQIKRYEQKKKEIRMTVEKKGT